MPLRIAIEDNTTTNGNNNIVRGHWVIDASSRTWDDTGTWIDTRIWEEGDAPLLPHPLPFYM